MKMVWIDEDYDYHIGDYLENHLRGAIFTGSQKECDEFRKNCEEEYRNNVSLSRDEIHIMFGN